MPEAIGAIKKRLSQTEMNQIDPLLSELAGDPRAGVQALVAAFQRKRALYLEEIQRMKKISEEEEALYEQGFLTVGGMDEVGRGPLAGPVVACCVILKRDCNILGIRDSKKLSAQKREMLADAIRKEARAVGIGVVPPARIDEINILQATFEAMRLAVLDLSVKPDALLIDALTVPGLAMKQKGIVKGDDLSISIGAASIVAKVYRDDLMVKMDALYPGYGFAENKGYGTREHIEALQALGPCPIHRRTFIKNLV